VIGAARATDLPMVIRLLQASGLPHNDVTAALLAHYLVAGHAEALQGVIGLEPLGTVGLLRSLAVAAAHRGRGLGVELTAALERDARGLGITELYLLTTTAEPFFGALGYRTIPRGDAPPPLQETTEFRELCSSTSVCMVKTLE
jgi:N-acetylglutamate synthase-like GNAT family acetyltransferase